jgi:hypothetical protein
MAIAPKKWMKKAITKSHEGKFTAKADRARESDHEYDEENKQAKKRSFRDLYNKSK